MDEPDSRVQASETAALPWTPSPPRHLRVVAEAHPGALARVIERFQSQNIIPRRVLAEVCASGSICIQVEVVGVPDSLLTLIANKLRELPCVLSSHWHVAFSGAREAMSADPE